MTLRAVARAFAASVLAAMAAAGAGCGSVTGAALEHAHDSPEALARAVLAAVAANDRQALQALAVSEREFRDRVWPDLPAARPERNLPLDYVWGDLQQKSMGHLRSILAQHGGRRYELIDVTFLGETTSYRTFDVARRAQLRVRDDRGEDQIIRLFGSVIRSRSEYKLFSFVVD